MPLARPPVCAHTLPVGPCFCTSSPAELHLPEVWTCDHRGHHGSAAVHDTSWLPPGPFGDIAHQLLKKKNTLEQHLVTGVEKTVHVPSLVTLQGVASPPLPIGCAGELHGLSLHSKKGQHLTYGVPRKARRANEATAIASPSASGGTRGDYKRQDVNGQVLEQRQRESASTATAKPSTLRDTVSPKAKNPPGISNTANHKRKSVVPLEPWRSHSTSGRTACLDHLSDVGSHSHLMSFPRNPSTSPTQRCVDTLEIIHLSLISRMPIGKGPVDAEAARGSVFGTTGN